MYYVDHKLDFDVWAQENVHVLTTALKSFFQELPSPLIPESLIEPLCGIIGETQLTTGGMHPNNTLLLYGRDASHNTLDCCIGGMHLTIR